MSRPKDPTRVKIYTGEPVYLQRVVNDCLREGWSIVSGPTDSGWGGEDCIDLVVTLGLFEDDE